MKSRANYKSKAERESLKPEMQRLCLSCGLCCNGVLFADVPLEAGDDAEKLRRLGVSKAGKFNQPCAALNGCECRIYPDRPGYCRKFECLLFKKVRNGEVSAQNALATISKARAAVAKTESLLAELGSVDKHLPLRKRFQAHVKKMEAGDVEDDKSQVFADLTLAFH